MISRRMQPRARFIAWLETSAGPWKIGQVAIQRIERDYLLCHEADMDRLEDLAPIKSIEEWRKTIFFNDKDEFRPLKASPDFATGWLFGLLRNAEVYSALQFAYPAAVAEWAAEQDGTLHITPWQETAERQTGRFNIVAKLDTAQKEQLVRENCATACAKHRLWPPGDSIANPPRPADPATLPLLCPEACNYLVGKAREILKGPMD